MLQGACPPKTFDREAAGLSGVCHMVLPRHELQRALSDPPRWPERTHCQRAHCADFISAGPSWVIGIQPPVFHRRCGTCLRFGCSRFLPLGGRTSFAEFLIAHSRFPALRQGLDRLTTTQTATAVFVTRPGLT